MVSEVDFSWDFIPGELETTPCMWDWGDNICLYGSLKKGGRFGGNR